MKRCISVETAQGNVRRDFGDCKGSAVTRIRQAWKGKVRGGGGCY